MKKAFIAFLTIAIFVSLICAPAGNASGPSFSQMAKITAGDSTPGNDFGISVSISGDTMVVGARYDDEKGFESGAAYVFYRDQGGADAWGQVAKITGGDSASGDYFGTSVSISGDTVVIGAEGDDDNGSFSGSAYIFSKDQGGADAWGQVAKIRAGDGTKNDYFGTSVSISGDTVVIGADCDVHYEPGSAYIYYRDQGGADAWGQVAKIMPGDVMINNRFGFSTSISGDTAVIGDIGDDEKGIESGSVYVYYRDQGGADAWGKVAKITAGDSTMSDHFGFSASISENTLVVGASGNDDNGSHSGSAYIFYKDQGGADAWGQAAKILPLDSTADDNFGNSVSINRDTVVIGASGNDDNGSHSGSAYIFNKDQGGADAWGQVTKITPGDGAENDQFGCSVSISGGTLVIGAKGIIYDSGSAYVYLSEDSDTDGGSLPDETDPDPSNVDTTNDNKGDSGGGCFISNLFL